MLLHELAHVRQHDCLLHLVAQMACALHWFDPLAWIALRRLRIERELAADDAVLAAGARPTSYAEELLAVAHAIPSPRAVPAGALGMTGEPELVRRVLAIVEEGRTRGRPSRARLSALALSVGALVAAVSCVTPTPPRPTQEARSLPATALGAPADAPSTLDPALQAIAEDELARVLAESNGKAGTILVLDPRTGAILANAGREAGAPAEVALQNAYVPGSTFKALTLAGALEDGVITPGVQIDCENGSRLIEGRRFHDASKHGVLTLGETLAVSSNVGFSKIFDRLGGERLGHWLRRFRLGVSPFPGAASGQLPARVEDRSYEGATLAIGGEAANATPLQMAAAYAVFANGGEYVAPTRAARATAPRERIVTVETARAVLALLGEAVNGEHATGKLARVPGVAIAGKTGTASWDLAGGSEGIYASFIGIAPAGAPRFVVLVGVEQPKQGSGGTVAAPAFARFVARALR